MVSLLLSVLMTPDVPLLVVSLFLQPGFHAREDISLLLLLTLHTPSLHLLSCLLLRTLL
jgi:hypothetical protein